jgi:glycerol uptake facilitator-like aquaporin
MSLSKRAIAEFFGTFWLVFGGCGSAVLAAACGGWALSQLWLFWPAPIAAGVLAGGFYRAVLGE